MELAIVIVKMENSLRSRSACPSSSGTFFLLLYCIDQISPGKLILFNGFVSKLVTNYLTLSIKSAVIPLYVSLLLIYRSLCSALFIPWTDQAFLAYQTSIHSFVDVASYFLSNISSKLFSFLLFIISSL